MLVKQLISLIDRNETNRVMLFPTQGQLGISNGNFISMDLNAERLQDVYNEEIISVFVYNNILAITI